MTRILVTGANGQLGNEFRFLAKARPEHYTFVTRTEMDLSDISSSEKYLREQDCDIVIHCAAYTAVDKAESERELALKINRDASAMIAKVCTEKGIPLVSYSSDYVYHNEIRRPMIEADAVTPCGVYALSKLEGEKAIAKATEKYFIFRTSWVFGSFGNNFVKTMIRLMTERDTLSIVDDQIGAPTYARDIAHITLEMMPHFLDESPAYGIYNLSNDGICSWYEFAKKIKSLLDLECELTPIPSSAYPTAAKRPLYSVMNNSKREEVFAGTKMPLWDKSLEKCLIALGHKIHPG